MVCILSANRSENLSERKLKLFQFGLLGVKQCFEIGCLKCRGYLREFLSPLTHNVKPLNKLQKTVNEDPASSQRWISGEI